MIAVLIVAGILICAFQALRVQRLLISAIWLAGASALTALMIYLLGAPEVAVIELSVGAGLVTVLFVFAINIAGDEVINPASPLPKALSIILVLIAVVLLGVFSLPYLNIPLPVPQMSSFARELWENRTLDVLLQVALIFAGVLGMIGLLSEGKSEESEQEHSA